MKFVSWNVNSIRARLDIAINWLESNNPDILMLQELKCTEDSFPFEAFSHLSYNYAIHGQKSYNGVAILSKYPIDEIKYNFESNPIPNEARYIEISLLSPIGYLRAINIYVPNGGEVNSDKFITKLEFFRALNIHLSNFQKFDEHIIIGGDFNIAPFDRDVYSPQTLEDDTCFTLKEKELIREMMNKGWFDLYRIKHPYSREYSWWDYRGKSFGHDHGMRIDMLFGNAKIAQKLEEIKIDKVIRAMEKASDHAPVVAIIK